MNAMSGLGAVPPIPVIPEDAPFNATQRAWLNGFLAGFYGGAQNAAAAEPEDLPWHDPALALQERLAMAEGRPLRRRLMAAMAQLDCGQCGYLCQTYAEALAEGRETSAGLCVPGAKPTMRALKAILAETPPAPAAAGAEPVAAAAAASPVRVLSAERLTRQESDKDVRHVVIDLAGSGLSYEPGDSLSLACPNDPGLVDACIAALGATGDESVGERTLRHALTFTHDVARPHDRVTDLLAMTATDPAHAAALRRLSGGEDGAEPEGADLLDLLQAFPSARPPLADLLRALPSLKPRLYSIASSPAAAGEQVHLCVSTVRAERRGRVRDGVASAHLADRAAGETLRAAVHVSRFRLPRDPATPVIMVGPGTGIAPFRAFLQHRAAAGIGAATGARTWLFFGDRREASDFLYRAELERWRRDGTLTRLDLAFSRDQPEKVYVQDRMEEHGPELWRWLQDGACLYVCGDATRMARDVDEALRRVAAAEGRMDERQARDWAAALAHQGRYQRDVY